MSNKIRAAASLRRYAAAVCVLLSCFNSPAHRRRPCPRGRVDSRIRTRPTTAMRSTSCTASSVTRSTRVRARRDVHRPGRGRLEGCRSSARTIICS